MEESAKYSALCTQVPKVSKWPSVRVAQMSKCQSGLSTRVPKDKNN